MKTKMITTIIILLVFYVAYGLFLYFFQKSFIYFPSQSSFYECPFFSQDEIREYNGTRFYFREGNNKLIVVYHGNAGRACNRAHFISSIDPSYSYLIVEYSGYGGDSDLPSKKNILQDVKNIVSFTQDLDKEVYLFGESIGSSVASYHASLDKPEGLIMIAPFHSLASVANSQFPIYPVRLLLTQNYDTSNYLKGYEGRVLIFHGTSDRTVPPRESEKLAEELSNVQRVTYDRAHNNLYSDELFEEVRGFIR